MLYMMLSSTSIAMLCRGGQVRLHGPVRQLLPGLQQLVQERGALRQGRQLLELEARLAQRLLLPHLVAS